MTALSDIKAISPTANAKAVVTAKGADINALMAMAQQHAGDLKVVVAQIVALHPTGGGDAANFAALQAVLAELA
jgi:glycine/D-amino acid oxidase-like deaminating enzyme